MICIYARSVTADLASLVKQLDGLVGHPKDNAKQPRAFLVFLNDDADGSQATLKKAAEEHKIVNTPLTVFDSDTGPPSYKIAKDAEVTVLLWKKRSVEHNFAFDKGGLDAAAVEKIVKVAKEFVQ